MPLLAGRVLVVEAPRCNSSEVGFGERERERKNIMYE